MDFHITGSTKNKPSSKKTIFADGSGDSSFRKDVDIELSHWIPNCTQEEFKADTSTEICIHFVASQSPESWQLAINNHLDVDGLLSIFTLVHHDFALQHSKTIIQAAEMGDFWGWGEKPAQILFQGLTLLMNQLEDEKLDYYNIYAQCFEKIISLLEKNHSAVREIKQGLNALSNSVDAIESGKFQRQVYHKHFVHYHIPSTSIEDKLAQFLEVPKFNDLLSENILLLPQARNRYDREKVQLISIESEDGWYYDLWYPGYMWADTPNSWRAPGFRFSGSTNGHYYDFPPLNNAIERLQELETGQGRWVLVKELTVFKALEGRHFPIVLSSLDKKNKPIVSKLSPNQVAFILSPVFL